MKLSQVQKGTILEIRVKPKSGRFKIESNDEIIVSCREKPIKGRVNRELVKELSRLFEKRVEIVSGFKLREKKILIRDAKLEEVRETLNVVMS